MPVAYVWFASVLVPLLLLMALVVAGLWWRFTSTSRAAIRQLAETELEGRPRR